MPVHVAIGLLHRFPEIRLQTFMAFQVVQFVAEHNLTIAVHGHAVVGVRQIFRREPEIQRVFRH